MKSPRSLQVRVASPAGSDTWLHCGGKIAFATALLGIVVALLVLAGCQSYSPAHYISPRVMGRVLDEKTREPVPGVTVQRVVPDYQAGTMDQINGGQALVRMEPPRSKADGTFVLDSQKSVALFRDLAWFTVEISFTQRSYDSFTTNYTPKLATNSPSGEPVIYAGDILMTRKSE